MHRPPSFTHADANRASGRRLAPFIAAASAAALGVVLALAPTFGASADAITDATTDEGAAAPGETATEGTTKANDAPVGSKAARVLAAYRESRKRIDAGDTAEAFGPAKRAYDYAQQDLGPDDEALAITAANLGTLLLDLGRPVDALRPLTHAGELFDRQKGPSSAIARQQQRRIGQANLDMGRYETAERTYLALIERTKKAEGDKTRELARLYARLQQVTLDADAKVRARRYGLRAMKLYRQALGPDSLFEGLVVVKLARGALDIGDWDDGLELLEHGVPILEKHLQLGDPQLGNLYAFLVEVYSTVGDASRERRFRLRLKKTRAKEPKTS